MKMALFDPITNSEDEMVLRAGIPRYKACTYLRAYIMASLCFEPQFVISDTSVNLNKAFRTLVDYDEGDIYTLEDLPQWADFDWLIHNGYIRFAARDKFKGNFSDALRKSQSKMKHVDLPGEKYTKTIDEISSNEYIYWYGLDEISRKFTNNFRHFMDDELYKNFNTLPENAKLLRELIHRLSDEETFTYNDVKKILLEEYKYNIEDQRYKYVHNLLRKAYDYNIPDLLGLDYCMPLHNEKPSRNQEWTLELSYEQELECNFVCDVYGLAKLPVKHLTYIWESKEYANWEKQVGKLRDGIIDLNEYHVALNNYLLKINDVVRDIYSRTSPHNEAHKKVNISRVPIIIRHYVKADDTKVVIAKFVRDAWKLGNTVAGLGLLSVGDMFFKMLPNLVQKSVDFPVPPEEIRDAVILQNKAENESN